MTAKSSGSRTGYTNREFNSLFQLYSAQVYTGLFRDFTFGEDDGYYRMAFREEAGKPPLITIEKRGLGSDRVLFVATTPGSRGLAVEIARSEKLESFVLQIRAFIEKVKAERAGSTGGGNVKSLYA